MAYAYAVLYVLVDLNEGCGKAVEKGMVEGGKLEKLLEINLAKNEGRGGRRDGKKGERERNWKDC